MAGGFGSVVFGYILWRWTGNIWIAAIVSVVLWPLMNPIIMGLLQLPVITFKAVLSLFEPDMPVSVLKEIDAASNGTQEKGMRVLLVTKGETPFFVSGGQRELFENIANEAVCELYEKNEVFRFKLDAVRERNLPVRIYATWYKSVPDKCLSKWRKVLKTEAFPDSSSDNDFFALDKFALEDGKKRDLSIVLLFDKALANPPKQETPTEDGKSPERKTDYRLQFDERAVQLA